MFLLPDIIILQPILETIVLHILVQIVKSCEN